MLRRRHPRVGLLRALPLFAACTNRELEIIATVTDDLELPAGRTLTREGRSGLECFVIIEGEASVTIGGTEVARVGPGDVVGEMAVIDGRSRSATVVAVGPMYVIVISGPAFSALLADHPSVSRVLLETLSERMRTLLPAKSA